jgi:Uma2 family endonuclease
MIERPMAIEPTPTAGAFEDLLRIVEQLDTPDGYKAELIRGKIVVSPWSKLRYKRAMKSLRRQLEPHAPKGHDVDVAPFLFVFPGAERGFGPDLHVADEAAFDAEGRHADGEALSLVAELTSTSTKDVDWLDRLDTYGRVVPVYLVLDMQAFEQLGREHPGSGRTAAIPQAYRTQGRRAEEECPVRPEAERAWAPALEAIAQLHVFT